MKKAVFGVCLWIMFALTSVHGQGNLDQRVSELSQKISNGLTENQKRTIAVVEFSDLRGRVTDFGRFIAEELITRLYETKKFKVIERQLLNKIISEQKLSLTGIIDQTSAQKLGRLLGVDAIATGTVTDLGKSLRVNARLIDTSTAEIFAVASTEVVKDDAVTRLMGGSDSSTTSEDARTSQPTQQRQSKTTKIDANFFTFELQQCLISGTAVICDFVITNNGDDRQIGLGEQTKLFDDQGNEHAARHVRIASKEGHSVYNVLVSGIAAKVRFTFEAVPAQTRRIILLDVYVAVSGVEGGRRDDFKVKFRSIPLQGPGTAYTDVEDTAPSNVAASIYSGKERTITVQGNQQWTDTEIDVWPGMRLEVNATGRVYITNQTSAGSQILGGLLNRNGRPLPPRSVGTNALLAKLRYTRGGESNALKVGDQNTLIVEDGEAGRLWLGVDDKNVTDNSGYFTVRIKW